MIEQKNIDSQEGKIKVMFDINDGYNVCCDACKNYIGYGECTIFIIFDEGGYNLLCQKCWRVFFPNSQAELADCTGYFMEKEKSEEGLDA